MSDVEPAAPSAGSPGQPARSGPPESNGPTEGQLLLASGAYFFLLLCGYSILRPLRDTAGIAGDSSTLAALFLATFLAMLVLTPIHGAIVSRVGRSRFVVGSTLLFAFQLLGFAVLFRARPEWSVAIGRVFFVWVSVFNLFVVSIFWSLMADRWSHPAGLRLFGVISAFGSVGGIIGSQLTARLAGSWAIEGLLLLSTALLLGTVPCARAVGRRGDPGGGDAPVGGSVLAGAVELVREPLLRRAATLTFLLTVCASLAYFLRAEWVATAEVTDEARRALFARTDTATQALTLLLQLLGFRLLVRGLGIGGTLLLLPAVYALGFLLVASAPVFGALLAFEATRRSFAYGLAAPTRNVVFTVVGDEAKYKTKACIDTLVYRGGDVVGAHLFALLAATRGGGWVAGPVGVGLLYAVIAGVTALQLGREVRSRRETEAGVTRPGP